jgi:precorrin-3B synthase
VPLVTSVSPPPAGLPTPGQPSGAARAEPDACPGALRIHQAADGGLARVRLPGGRLTGDQLAALLATATEFGDGRLELTARGNIQLRGLGADATGPLAGALRAAGLLPSDTHELVRNVLSSPLSGLDGAGLLDMRGWAAHYDAELCADPVLADLPGRFLVAFDDGRGDVAALRADVTVRAVGPDTVAVLLADVDVGLRLIGRGLRAEGSIERADTHLSAQSAVVVRAAARAFLAERDAQGNGAWRLAELADGPARVAARLGHLRAIPAEGTAWRPPDGAAAGIPDGAVGGTARQVRLGVLPQRDGRVTLGVLPPLGALTGDQAALLVDLVARKVASEVASTVAGELIVTAWREILVPDLDAVGPDLLAACAAVGLVTTPDSPWTGVTACAGAPGCAKSLADVRADAKKVHSGLHRGTDAPAVHWIGCARACGRPAGPSIEVLATGSGYLVTPRGTVDDGAIALIDGALIDGALIDAAPVDTALVDGALR